MEMKINAATPIGILPEGDKKQILFVAKKMEALWIKEVMKQARPQGGGLLENSLANQTFKSMFDEAIADQMSEANTIGLAAQIVKQMQPAKSSEMTRLTAQTNGK